MFKKINFSKNAKFKKDLFKDSKKFLFIGRDPIVETNTLKNLLKEDEDKTKNLKIIDCTFYENENIPVPKEIKHFDQERIPRSIKIDISEISNSKKSEYNQYILPSDENFTNIMNKHNIKKSDHIICYDRHGIYSSARLWYILKLFGLKNIYVLNGGYPKWVNEKNPIEKSKYTQENNSYSSIKSSESNNFIYTKDEINLIQTESMLYSSYNFLKGMSNDIIIDARSPMRYLGDVDEPYAVRRRGSIKYSANIYYRNLLDKNFCLLNKKLMKHLFESEMIELDKDLIVYSGVGISACVVILALDYIGKHKNVRFYEGGWAEMGNIEVTGNQILNKFYENENKTSKEQIEDIESKMDKDTLERYHKQDQYKYKRIDVQEKNKEYLKKKLKAIENDYESPDEKF